MRKVRISTVFWLSFLKVTESLTPVEFADCMAALAPYEPAPVLAMGVSGGGDSMALLCLADFWARPQGGRVIALTVDHQLRVESAAEAKQVAQWCQALGIEHHILNWAGNKPTTAIQANARQVRYDLLETFCRQQHILHLLTAHHQDDQAETVFLRFIKGSSLIGLAGMQAVNYRDHLRLLRPLLTIPKSRLLKTCYEFGQPYIEDPSNDNLRFTRVRIRKILAELNDETSADQLLQGQEQGQSMQKWLHDLAQSGLAETVRYHPNHLIWNYQAWHKWPEPVRLLGLRQVIEAAQPQQKFMRQARLHNMAAKLWDNPKPFKAATLGGLYFRPQRDNSLHIYPEEMKSSHCNFNSSP